MAIRRLEEKCNACLLCVKDCVAGVIQEQDKAPAIVAPDWCNRCSHCLAVCPKDAIVNDALNPSDVRPVHRDLLSPKAFAEIVLSRRSVRQYKKRPVARETVEKILDVARFSPTASNTQNVSYIVVQDGELLQKISERVFSFGQRLFGLSRSTAGRAVIGAAKRAGAGASLDRYINGMEFYQQEAKKGRDFILHHAPVLLLVLAPSRAPFSCDNCNIAAANITNYAHSLGLGTCYTGMLTMALKFDPALRKMVKVPRGKRVFASLVMGHPAYAHTRTASRKQPEVRWL